MDDDSDGAVDDGCHSVLYAYDNLNRLSSQKDALGNTWSYAYDAASRLTSRTDAKGVQTTYAYNARGDLTTVTYPGPVTVTFQYDAARRRTQMADATGTTTYAYDAANRPTSVTFPGPRTVSFTYTNVGERATMTYPGGTQTVTYGYDAASDLTVVTDWNGNQTRYAYDNAGRLTTTTLPSGTGVAGSFSYDNADRLVGVSWAKGGQTLRSASYTLDAVGNRTQRVDQLGTHTYAYDNLYRLTSVTYPGPTTDTYTYDAVGNRLTKNAVTHTYDAADRMLTAGGVSYGYDNNGNTTSRGADAFAWDAEDRLTSATVAGVTTTFAYNGDGLRHSRTTGGNTVTFTWDVAVGIPQVLDDGAFKYVYGLGRIAEVGPGATPHYYLADGLGSTMGLVDASGNIVNTYDYDVFGAVRQQTGGQANEYQFAGEQVDAATGLQYLRARFYDMATGRFLSRDPLPGISGLPLSQSRYAYALAHPTDLVDPSGLCVVGAPCPGPIKNTALAVSGAASYAYNELRGPAILIMDSTAIALSGQAVAMTDVSVVGGCLVGLVISKTPAGCVAGYAFGLWVSTPFRVGSNLASTGGALLTCMGPLGKESIGTFAENCAFSAVAAVLGWLVPDPHVGLALDLYIACRDLRKCGP